MLNKKSNLNIVLVTCELTHVPNNYHTMYEQLLKNIKGSNINIKKVVILKYINTKHFLDIIGLFLGGMWRFSLQMLINSFRAMFNKKLKFFTKNGYICKKLTTINSPQFIQWVKENNIDIIINLRTKCIYSEKVLKAPKIGCVNIHHGILPENKGILCDLHNIINKTPAGFSIHAMNKQIDGGQIFYREQVSHENENNYIKYLEKTCFKEANALAEFLKQCKKTNAFPKVIIPHIKSVKHFKLPTSLFQILKLRWKGKGIRL